MIIIPELREATIACVNIGQRSKEGSKCEWFAIFSSMLLRDLLLDKWTIVIDPFL